MCCSCAVACTAAEVAACLERVQTTCEEQGFLSVDEFCKLCCGWATATSATVTTSGAAAAAADFSAGPGAGAATARETELLAALEAARAENAGLRRRLEIDGGAAPAPAARAGCSGGIFDPAWAAKVRPLYDEHMGVENMGPLLYALIRFVKPRTILEVGAGYTTFFVLQALKDNEDELAHLRAESSAVGISAATEGGGTGEQPPSSSSDAAELEPGAEADSGFYVEDAIAELGSTSVLHCVDNEEHDVFTVHGGLGAVLAISEELGLSHLLKVHTADAFDLQLGGSNTEEPEAAAAVAAGMPAEWDMVWLDGITTDPRWPKYCELQYKCRFIFGFSIGNAEIMENCP